MGLFSAISGILGGGAQKKASRAAENAQLGFIDQGMSSIRDSTAAGQAGLDPYEDAGTGALSQIMALLGISSPGQIDYAAYVAGNPDLAAEWNRVKDEGRFRTPEEYGQWHYQTRGQTEGRDVSAFTSGATGEGSQADAIAQLEASPLFQSLLRNGEEGILQNNAATGNLRGGNIKSSLANFRADTLTRTIENQLARLGGLSGAGLSAATGSAQLGANGGAQIADMLGQKGQVRAGGLLTRGGITAGQYNNVGSFIDEAVKAAASAVGGGGGGGGGLGSSLQGLF